MTLAELEEIYMNGFADEVTGDVDSPVNHVYRVGKYLVETLSTGFKYVAEYETTTEAITVFNQIDAEYSTWLDSEEGI